MSLNFESFLSVEEKISIVQNKIKQLAQSGWQHQLDYEVFKEVGDASAMAQSEAAMSVLAAAIEHYQQKLAELSA